MLVLITGGTGFIGSRLALDWLQRGHSVRILGQENNAAESHNRRLVESKGGQIIIGSVTEKDKVFEILHGVDLVYHLAAAQHEANISDQIFWDVNVNGTKNILEASVQAQVKRFVHGSTIGVYGAALDGNLDERSPVNPDNIYGVTKLEAEKLALSFREKLPMVIVRISETYGPGDRRLLKLFRGIKKNAFFVIGTGQNVHHLLYIDDLVCGLYLAATVEAALGKIFVLSGKETVTTAAMAETISRQLGRKLPSFHLPLLPILMFATVIEKVCRPLGFQPPLHRRRMDFFRKDFCFSQEQAREILGFVPRVGFEEGVMETAGWYRQIGSL
jgi:nucleoside-diphosphate-sugar epimerase